MGRPSRPRPGRCSSGAASTTLRSGPGSEEAFREIRQRVESEAAADGDVTDMKTMWIMGARFAVDCDRFTAVLHRLHPRALVRALI